MIHGTETWPVKEEKR